MQLSCGVGSSICGVGFSIRQVGSLIVGDFPIRGVFFLFVGWVSYSRGGVSYSWGGGFPFVGWGGPFVGATRNSWGGLLFVNRGLVAVAAVCGVVAIHGTGASSESGPIMSVFRGLFV